ncbi:hypothetical protein WMY93_003598 [Mugilogobius chulae]|uniref:Uncharacterized protein n=1 Tax=Mugilogobius chulae TaxID=88201 RepID=A0AAW0Q7S8_9GOBI
MPTSFSTLARPIASGLLAPPTGPGLLAPPTGLGLSALHSGAGLLALPTASACWLRLLARACQPSPSRQRHSPASLCLRCPSGPRYVSVPPPASPSFYSSPSSGFYVRQPASCHRAPKIRSSILHAGVSRPSYYHSTSETLFCSRHIRQQIIAGKYVDLADLLRPIPLRTPVPRVIDSHDGFFIMRDPVPSRSKELSPLEFAFAFGLYRDTICSAFPLRREEFDAYLALILDLALRFGSPGFYQYPPHCRVFAFPHQQLTLAYASTTHATRVPLTCTTSFVFHRYPYPC